MHGDLVVLALRLTRARGPGAGEVAWAARAFLLLDEEGRIVQDYHLTVRPLAAA
ncbi:hypothetical protein V2S66_15345 [Streptomyces sp. V4-01]|uniref:Uncharacterized protein n=1 Tax=Actinacidiphila polyblastidii TaxID=3110430 RepID=A0ABU7PC09_9ACTN|nr:hypothetical protein [Streptomyces sp. V4-01]